MNLEDIISGWNGCICSGSGESGGGDKFSAYDYVIKQVDSGTPTLVKGSFNDIYDKLQAMEAVSGLYVRNVTPGPYHDTVCECYPIMYTYYYSSTGTIFGVSLYYDHNNADWKSLNVEFDSSGDVFVTRVS